MAPEESGTDGTSGTCESCKSFGQKCSHVVKKQRTKFYILRRCISMLLCWRDHERGGGSRGPVNS